MRAYAKDEKAIFLAALEQATEGEREAYLRSACGDDPELLKRVKVLLSVHKESQGPLDAPSPGVGIAPTIDLPLTEKPGTVIGPYKLLEQIGEGGFGLVFLAEQQQPVRRKVALKILKPGMDTRQVIARFEAERQALALMDHPNIARVLDAGNTGVSKEADNCSPLTPDPWPLTPDLWPLTPAEGRPYFVMELVKGVSITDYCDQNRLSTRARLELFVHVCQAVQHAHQKGIIHRDIKPSNVMVTQHDSVPVVKVIDFGIAKALGEQLTDKTLHTGFAQMVGTPMYMSPEQAQLSGLDIDTRSDIYSLGVLLYELLTGLTPFDKERLHAAGYDEMRRVIREEEPPRPSTRLSTLGPVAATVSERRQSDPKRLSQLLRGELDWIVMTALEKDRNRRYETASAFAADVQRYLHDEPVQAFPPSAWYRLRKFARRHRAGLTMAAVVTAALAVVVAGAWWSDRQQTALAAKERIEAARQRAETERSITAALTEAETLLAQGDKETDYPQRWQATVRLAGLALERAERLQAAGAVTEELAAGVRQTRAALAVAEQDSQLRTALDRLQADLALLGPGLSDASRAKAGYAAVLKAYGVDPASPQEAAARVRASRFREELLAALVYWGRLSRDAAEVERLKQVVAAAEPAPDAFRARWLAAVRRRDDAAMLELAAAPELQQLPWVALMNMIEDLRLRNHLPAAERMLRPALQRFPGDYWLNTQLGTVLLKQRKFDEALPYMTAALAVRHDFPGAHINLGVALFYKGDLDGAIRQYKVALQLDERNVPALCDLGIALQFKGNLKDSIDAFQAALRIDPKSLNAHGGLGNALKAKDDLEGAIRCYETALQINPEGAAAHYDLGQALMAKKDLMGAIKHFRAAAKSDPSDADAPYNLGCALEATGDLDGAKTSYEAALKIYPSFTQAHQNLGTVFLHTKHPAEAVHCFEAALKIDPRRVDAHYNMGLAYEAQGDLDTAIRWYQAALVLNPQDAKVHNNLGHALADKKDLVGALRCYQAALKIDPQYALAYINQGRTLALNKDLEGAIRSYQDGLKIEPQDGYGHVVLGEALRKQGRFAEAAQETALALKFLPPGSRYVAGATHQLQGCQEMAPLAAKLPAVLRGEEKLKDAAQTARFAWLCQEPYHQLNRAAAQFYVKAFSADPKLADKLGEQHRFNAACAAVLASTGQGKDAAQLKEEERSQWAKQALAWLQAELTAYAQVLQTGQPKNLAWVQQRLQRWRNDDNLAAVRDAAAIGRLPAEERQAWTTLWADVAELLEKAGNAANP